MCIHAVIQFHTHTHHDFELIGIVHVFLGPIHSFKVGRVGDEELFDVIQFTHSFQLEAQAARVNQGR